MKVYKTEIEGCLILEPALFEDERGFFMESYNQASFNKATGLEIHFVQDNQSFSKRGVIRALHYQRGTHAQAKLVRALQGEVLDVAVDLRQNSETFGRHVAVVLSGENRRQMFIPRGFAHGFVVLSETAEFFYKCDNYYNASAEGGIIYNDKDLNIDWKLSERDIILSPKDAALPTLKNAAL